MLASASGVSTSDVAVSCRTFGVAGAASAVAGRALSSRAATSVKASQPGIRDFKGLLLSRTNF